MQSAVLATALLASFPAFGTPLRPDLNKLLARPQPKQTDFAPARAGWDGPELVPPEKSPNPILERYSPQASARAARATLMAIAVPDIRVVLAITLVIFLLRRIRKATLEAPETSNQQPQNELRPAA